MTMARLAGRVAGVPRALGSFLDRRGGLVLVRVGGEDGDGVPGGHDGGCPGARSSCGRRPDPVIGGARRVRVLIGRVPRGEGMRMSSEPATVTRAAGGPGLRL